MVNAPNVLQFPSRPRAVNEADVPRLTHAVVTPSDNPVHARVGARAGLALRVVLLVPLRWAAFFLLGWLGGPIGALLRLASVASLIGVGMFLAVRGPDTNGLLWTCLGVGLVAHAASYLLERFVRWLEPR